MQISSDYIQKFDSLMSSLLCCSYFSVNNETVFYQHPSLFHCKWGRSRLGVAHLVKISSIYLQDCITVCLQNYLRSSCKAFRSLNQKSIQVILVLFLIHPLFKQDGPIEIQYNISSVSMSC